ncbi:MAG TPA: O-antigen ligase family protein [Gaiellaceae bacterium]
MAASAPHRLQGAGPYVLAGAVPLLLLHRHYQPDLALGSIDVDLSDVAVAAICIAALAGRGTIERERRTGLLGVAAFALGVVLSTAWGAHFNGYDLHAHAITTAKWVEYMLLAPAVVLIARRQADLLPAAVTAVAWSTVVTLIGVLQYVGALGDLEHTPAGRRKSSLLGYHDFSALSASVLVLALLVVATGRGPRRLAALGAASGALGMVIGGAFDAVLGLILASFLIVLACRVRDVRRLAVVAGVVLAVLAGTVAIRSQAVADGLKFLGLKQGTGGASEHVQSYRQRVLLAYIGGRIFIGHPLLGVGFNGSLDEFAYRPYLADARAKFDQPPEAFPSPSHPWGVQNAYVQALSDFGALGVVLFLVALFLPVWLALRRGARPLGVAAAAVVLVTAGVWNGLGLVAGIPTDAITWIGVGAAIASVPCAARRVY